LLHLYSRFNTRNVDGIGDILSFAPCNWSLAFLGVSERGKSKDENRNHGIFHEKLLHKKCFCAEHYMASFGKRQLSLKLSWVKLKYHALPHQFELNVAHGITLMGELKTPVMLV
jgi:hypothetical protein